MERLRIYLNQVGLKRRLVYEQGCITSKLLQPPAWPGVTRVDQLPTRPVLKHKPPAVPERVCFKRLDMLYVFSSRIETINMCTFGSHTSSNYNQVPAMKDGYRAPRSHTRHPGGWSGFGMEAVKRPV